MNMNNNFKTDKGTDTGMDTAPEVGIISVIVRDTAQENVMNAHEETRLFLVVVNQPKNITAISTRQPII